MKCSICQSEEIHIAGQLGILEVAVCVTCYCGIEDMVHKMVPCIHCGKLFDEEETNE